jgi:hypothetical protein
MAKKALPMDKEKVYKLDMFKDVLPAVNRKDRDFWDRCSDDEKKSIAPIVVQRWLSSVCRGFNTEDSVETGNNLIFINEIINKIGLYNIPSSQDRDHKKLQWLMLTVVGNGKASTKHSWVPFAGNSETPLLDAAIRKKWTNIGTQEFKMIRNTISEEQLIDLCKDLAYDDKDIKKTVKEFKSFQGE